MFVVNKKRFGLIVICILLAIFAYTYEGMKLNLKDEEIEVASTPISGKVVVVDAGHRCA